MSPIESTEAGITNLSPITQFANALEYIVLTPAGKLPPSPSRSISFTKNNTLPSAEHKNSPSITQYSLLSDRSMLHRLSPAPPYTYLSNVGNGPTSSNTRSASPMLKAESARCLNAFGSITLKSAVYTPVLFQLNTLLGIVSMSASSRSSVSSCKKSELRK